MLAKLFEDIGDAGRVLVLCAVEGRILQGNSVGCRDRNRGVEVHQAREVDRAVGGEDLRGVELEVDAQPLGDVRVGAGLDLQAHGVALAAVVQLGAHALQHGARLFLLQVEVAVAGDAEGRAGEHGVAAEHGLSLRLDEVMEKDEAMFAGGRGQCDQARQRTRHGDDAKLGLRDAQSAGALAAQKQSEAERFVQHTREGVRRVDRDRGEQRVDLGLVEVQGMRTRCLIEFVPLENVDLLFGQRGDQKIVPAGVLRGDEGLQVGAEPLEAHIRRQTLVLLMRRRLPLAVFNALQQAGEADLDELIQVAGGDGEELHTLQQGIRRVLRLLQHALVEGEPGVIAPEIGADCVLGCFGHFR